MWPGRRARLFRLFRRTDPAADVDAELSLHVELAVEELIRRGVPPADARTRALAAFGNLGATRAKVLAETRRHQRIRHAAERLVLAWREVRLAVRSLRRAPAVSLGATIALALGIGATTAIFSIGHGIIGSLPVPEPERLVQLVNVDRDQATDDGPLRLAELIAIRAQLRTLAGVGAWTNQGIHLGDGKRVAERVAGERITAGLFATLQVAPQLGREFVPADEAPGAPPVLLLSDRLWRDRFGGDRSVVGTVVRANGRPAIIVGVMPPEFEFPSQAKAWLPLAVAPGLAATDTAPGYLSVARLAPGRRLEELQAEAARLGLTLIRDRGGNLDREQLTARPFSDHMIGPAAVVRVHALTVLVSSILFIACANVSNLLLVRALGRGRELAIRAALGSSRAAVARSLALEAVLLAAAGGAIGVGLAAIGVHAADQALGAELPFWSKIRIDWAVLGFVATLVVIAAVLAAVAPARRATATDPGDALRRQTKGTTARLGWISRELITAQIGLATLLLIVTGLMVQGILGSVRRLPADRPDDMATARIELDLERFPTPADQRLVVGRIVADLRALPGVVAVAAGTNTPGFTPAMVPFRVVGAPADGGAPPWTFVSSVTPGYFATYGIPVLRGREFTAFDRDGAPRVALVTARFASRHFPDGAALGNRLEVAGPSAPFRPGLVRAEAVEIVGVVPDNDPLDEPSFDDFTVYLPFAQATDQRLAIGIRTTGDPTALIRQIGPTVLAVDPDVPVFRLGRLSNHYRESTKAMRMFATMFAIFGVAGLLIASVGLFAIVGFGVRQRYHEIAIRAALGERPRSVLWRIAWPSALRLGAGLGLGAAVAALIAPKLGPLLFGSSPHELGIVSGVALAVATVSLIAILAPARRGLTIDPAEILRQG